MMRRFRRIWSSARRRPPRDDRGLRRARRGGDGGLSLGEEIGNDTIKRLLRKAVITGAFFPVLCGSAFKNKGVQPLLDAVVDYLPSPVDVPPIKGIDPRTDAEVVRRSSDDEPLSMLAFKIMDDPYGVLTFARIYSGRLTKGSTVLNSTRGKTDRIGRMVLMHANSREEISEAYAGDIVALVGLEGHPHRRHAMRRGQAGHPASGWNSPIQSSRWRSNRRPRAIRRRWRWPLNKLATEDPSFHVSTDQESGQTIIKGMGELHLDIKVDILKRTHKVEVNVGAPQVAYRETITRRNRDRLYPQEADRRHRPICPRQVCRRAERKGPGLRFENKIVGGAVPKEYIPGVEKGLNAVMTAGTIIGFPVVDVKVSLIDGAYHEVDSSTIAFEIAARYRFPRGLAKGGTGAPRADHESRGGDA